MDNRSGHELYKCPLIGCEWAFVRKYERNYHLLDHCKWTLTCGFCPETDLARTEGFGTVSLFGDHLLYDHQWQSSTKAITEIQDRQTVTDEMQRENSTIDTEDDKPTDPAVEATIRRASGIDPEGLTESQVLGPRQNPATSYTECAICKRYFKSAPSIYKHLSRCAIRQLIIDEQDSWGGSKSLSDYLDIDPFPNLDTSESETSDAESSSEALETKSDAAQPVPVITTAAEQSPGLFVSRTISQDLSRGEEANTRDLLCALQDRPSGRRTESGDLRISSKKFFAEDCGDGPRKLSKRLFAEDREGGIGKISKRLFAEEGGSETVKRKKLYLR